MKKQFGKKRIGTRLTALGLAASALLACTMLTGCKKEDEVFTYTDDYGNVIVVEGENSYVSGGPEDPYVNNPNNTDINPGTTTTTSGSIEKSPPFTPDTDFFEDDTTISSKVVLENLDKLVTNFGEMSMFSGSKIDRDYYAFFGEFVALRPNQYGSSSYETIAVMNESCTPKHAWFNFKDSPYYNTDVENINNAYYITLDYEVSCVGKREACSDSKIIVPQKEFEALMQAFGHDKYLYTVEMAMTSESPTYYIEHVDKEVYDSITIDRETIENANQEQLVAINNLLKSMYLINLVGKTELPSNQFAE